MYIGPWQEYRLAKLQDDALQRLRSEFEQQLRAQIPERDDERIRELMQPMMAKLPALLLASKAKRATTTAGSSRKGKDTDETKGCENPETTASSRAASAPNLARPQSPRSTTTTATSSGALSRRSRGAESVKHPNNQETHEEGDDKPHRPQASSLLAKNKPRLKAKKKVVQPLTALEEVQRRKKMFAKWIKTTKTEEGPVVASDATSESSRDEDTGSSNTNVALPFIQRRVTTVTKSRRDTGHFAQQRTVDEDDEDNIVRLPPLRQLLPGAEVAAEAAVEEAAQAEAESEWDFLQPYEPSRDPVDVPSQPDLEDSLDEDEVNNLLDWTDTLLSPGAMDEFPLLGEDADALAVR